MNILIPIAGHDLFFRPEEYFFPKALVEVAGTPMIELCVRNLVRQFPQAHFIFIVQDEHCTKYSLDGMLQILTDGRCTIVRLDHLTKGALCSALLAIDHIPEDEPLIVTNGDQIIQADLATLPRYAANLECDAALVTFESLHPRWSFVRVDGEGFVQEAAEKRVISRDAIAGFYYYRTGKLFLDSALRTLEYEAGVDGAYFISQTLNNLILEGRKIAAGGTASATHRLFAGAKVVDILRGYQDSQKIVNFDYAVDWGWFWFLTRPFFWVLDHLYRLCGNFGLAILGLTVVVKLAFFPLANASFRAMSKMKKLQPKMEEIKKAHGSDPQKMQMEMMEMYKREKANPLSGCVPILLTIPVFIALYKVLFVTIEMRHAPFYGWIHDLSAPDPSSILNLFGLLPYNPHAFLPASFAFLSIGVWPIVMGATQWMQTKLNPAPADPIQAKMFSYMPVIFTFMFATFPSGLVIYYAWNNLLTVLQQAFIMKREGVEINFFDNIKAKKPAPKAAPKAAND